MEATVTQAPTLDFAPPFDGLRAVNGQAHAALLGALPALSRHLSSAADAKSLAEIIALVTLEAPKAARIFAERVCVQPRMLDDMAALRRWALSGLKGRSDSDRMLKHFKTNDPAIFSDAQALHLSGQLIDQIEGLEHYFAGFGFGDVAVDLHDPVKQGEAQLSPTLADKIMKFPQSFEAIGAAAQDTLYRATVAHAAAHLRFSPLQRPIGNRRPNLVALIALIEDARVERLMVRDHPGLHNLWDQYFDASKDNSGFDLDGLMARLARALHDPAYEDPNPWVNRGRELFEEAASLDLTDIAAFDRLARELTAAVGKMHLQLKANHRPTPLYRDDNAVLWGPDEALPEDETIEPEIDEIEIRPADQMPEGHDTPDIDLRPRHIYPEWDHQLQELRNSWTTVIEEDFDRARKAQLAHKPRRGRGLSPKAARKVPDRSARLKRLPAGDELDLNAVVDNLVQLRAGIAPDGRIFMHHGRRPKSTATIVLMDLSISTDKFVPGSFTRVIDLEKQTALAVTEELESESNRVAIHGFNSDGRNAVNYYCAKDMDESFDDDCRTRLEGLTSQLSTRMGAALRHATALLDQQASDNKVVLVLTDGAPSDIDVMDDTYLIEDAYEAVMSAAAKNVRTFCLTLDRRADSYVRRIFGERNYLISDQATTFTERAGTVLAQMLAP